MVGIGRYGVYVPRFRLDRRLIAEAWGSKQPPGEIAVANYDEDSLTMAVEAASSCIGDQSPSSIDGLFFASASSPYWEKQVASFVATACDLRRNILTADFAGSSRAGLSAMLAAIRNIQAGAAQRVVVAAADARLAQPDGELEGVLGNAAAAVTVGNDDVIAEFVDTASISEEFTYVWRTDIDRTVQIAGGRFSNQYGYERDLAPAIRTVLERQRLAPADIAHVALYSPDARASSDLAKAVGFDVKRQLGERLAAQIGCTGCAEPLLQLASALDRAKPGELILVGSYGEGADVLLFRATGAIGRQSRVESQESGVADSVSVAQQVAAKAMLPSYGKYLKYRRLIEVDEITEVVTNVLEFKELKQDVRLYGSRCLECGQVQYPIAHVCIRCHARERMEDARITRQGTVFTYTVDHLIPNMEHPLPMAVIDMDGGGRLYLQVADTDQVEVGDRVVLTFRRLHEGGGNHNYYWKARPMR